MFGVWGLQHTDSSDQPKTFYLNTLSSCAYRAISQTPPAIGRQGMPKACRLSSYMLFFIYFSHDL